MMDEKAGEPEGGAAPPTVDLTEARRLYEASGIPIAALCQRLGWSSYKLRAIRIREGWTPRPQVAVPNGLPRRRPSGDEALEFRLNRLIATGTEMLQARLTREGMTEANARMLTELWRAQEMRMRSEKAKHARIREKKNEDGGRDFRDDPAWLLAEFTRRLGRMEDADAGAASRDIQKPDSRGSEYLSR
jgi:hypothetical protein